MTSIQTDELGKLKTLFSDASSNKTFDKYNMAVIAESSPAWNRVRDYLTQLASKYNSDPAKFIINPTTGEITVS